MACNFRVPMCKFFLNWSDALPFMYKQPVVMPREFIMVDGRIFRIKEERHVFDPNVTLTTEVHFLIEEVSK